ncbi:LytTR family DNA-binding domain-containing protein [Cytophaga sp. FL35]|uniref:LytR/AlgR family response regulator transcription factor n=1 Tax=Cytophaga sp. FL35 TaxID=1904456 RepID=UPI0016535B2C|nr:LytTR family DNA-binding domain-containing protein [Cytophaga sp. FL35]MBC6999913.1 response regulator transcription factor [Cytophaga sp. FL35]
MRCIIIEDQPPAQRILKKYIDDMGALELRGVFSDAIQAMEFIGKEPIDLMFLDIHLPKISGIDFLKSMQNPPKVILTTAFPDYALESYEFNVVDYLLKPFSFQRFVKAVSKVSLKTITPQGDTVAVSTKEHPKEIYIKSGYEHIKVVIADIIHIESDADYTEIIIEHKKHLSSESLKFWEDTLPSDQFFRIHRSHIINTEKIEKLVGNQVYLLNGSILPIGRAYKDEFVKRILN